MLPEKLVIVGTDTSVGKTMVAALLLDYLRGRQRTVAYLKLVSCGGEQADDCLYCQAQSGVAAEAVYHFKLPASPHLAARLQGEKIDTRRLAAALAEKRGHDVLVVEGAGGLCVPLTDDTLLIDFLADQDLAALLVARSGLGTLNHTLLSIEALRARRMPVLGIIFSDEADYDADEPLVLDNMATVARFTGLPVLGRLRRCADFAQGRAFFAGIGQALLGGGEVQGARVSCPTCR